MSKPTHHKLRSLIEKLEIISGEFGEHYDDVTFCIYLLQSAKKGVRHLENCALGKGGPNPFCNCGVADIQEALETLRGIKKGM